MTHRNEHCFHHYRWTSRLVAYQVGWQRYNRAPGDCTHSILPRVAKTLHLSRIPHCGHGTSGSYADIRVRSYWPSRHPPNPGCQHSIRTSHAHWHIVTLPEGIHPVTRSIRTIILQVHVYIARTYVDRYQRQVSILLQRIFDLWE